MGGGYACAVADSRAGQDPPASPDPGPTLADLDRRRRQRLDEIPRKPHRPWRGCIWAPERPDQLVTLLRELPGPLGAWRGQADATWKIDSSLARRYRAGCVPHHPLDETNLRGHEQVLVEHARAAGFAEGLGELELLAWLQHHGAATRLLDCTRNAFVALWFACQRSWEPDGLLIGFRLRDDANIETGMLGWDIDRLLEHAEGRVLWWQPRALSARIPAQHAVFVLGKVVDERWGSIGLQGRPIGRSAFGDVPGVALILIPSALKEEMHRSWQDLFGFSEETLFPDPNGFARAHSVDREFQDYFPLGSPPGQRLTDL